MGGTQLRSRELIGVLAGAALLLASCGVRDNSDTTEAPSAPAGEPSSSGTAPGAEKLGEANSGQSRPPRESGFSCPGDPRCSKDDQQTDLPN